MKRLHLFEFGDLTWFPKKFRDYQTDYLRFAADTFDLYKGIIPVIKKGVESSNNNTIVDIASGGGGGWAKIAGHLKSDIPLLKIKLTDYYPNIDAFKLTKSRQPDVIEYVEESVNALDVPKSLKGFRTQFHSLHHFVPRDAIAILQNAVTNNQAIAIFEAQQRDFKNIFKMLLSPIAVLLMTPFIKPFKINRIIFTYLIPIIPLVILWDGIVSVLRTYTAKELKEMIASLKEHERFNWIVDIAKSNQVNISYVIGTPNKQVNISSNQKDLQA